MPVSIILHRFRLQLLNFSTSQASDFLPRLPSLVAMSDDGGDAMEVDNDTFSPPRRFQFTRQIPGGGLRVRQGPSRKTRQIASLEWPSHGNTGVLVTGLIHGAEVWAKLDASVYSSLRSTYQFQAFKPEEEGYVLVSNDKKTFLSPEPME